jgi:hypothetical protein
MKTLYKIQNSGEEEKVNFFLSSLLDDNPHANTSSVQFQLSLKLFSKSPGYQMLKTALKKS